MIEALDRRQLRGSADRANSSFRPDPWTGANAAQLSDYAGSGYDRGHQAPAGDAKASQAMMDGTFFLSNMAPQVGIGFNRGQWKYVEEEIRAWVLCGGHDHLIVVTGPIYDPDKTERYMRATVGRTQVRIPDAFFKVVYDPDEAQAVGFILQNQKYRRQDIAHFAVPIADIEDATGIDFFRALPRRRQNQLESSTGVVWGHDQDCTDNDE